MKLKHQLFAIDFDGTIAYDAWPEVGQLIPGAKETMLKIKELGGKIAIWTCRTDEHAQNARDFLDKNGIPYDKFNEEFDENINIYGGSSRKVFADVYIDDRCILWNGGPVDWKLLQNLIFINERWLAGDMIECQQDCMNNFRKGERYKIAAISHDGNEIVFGPTISELKEVQKYFKKVN